MCCDFFHEVEFLKDSPRDLDLDLCSILNLTYSLKIPIFLVLLSREKFVLEMFDYETNRSVRLVAWDILLCIIFPSF